MTKQQRIEQLESELAETQALLAKSITADELLALREKQAADYAAIGGALQVIDYLLQSKVPGSAPNIEPAV